jgi:HSP20 family protein
MAITRYYSPLRDVSSLQDEVERMFRQAFGDREAASTAGAFTPALDVEETEEGFTLHIELPGVAADDVEVSLEENVLSVAGERRFYEEKEAEGFRRIERHFGRFHRAVRLPDRVDPEGVSASYRDGMLTITVPKADEAKPRRIEIQAG